MNLAWFELYVEDPSTPYPTPEPTASPLAPVTSSPSKTSSYAPSVSPSTPYPTPEPTASPLAPVASSPSKTYAPSVSLPTTNTCIPARSNCFLKQKEKGCDDQICEQKVC